MDEGNEEYFDPLRRSDNNAEASREDLVEIETSSTAGLSGEASIQNPSKEWSFFKRSLMQRFPVSKTVLTYSVSISRFLILLVPHAVLYSKVCNLPRLHFVLSNCQASEHVWSYLRWWSPFVTSVSFLCIL